MNQTLSQMDMNIHLNPQQWINSRQEAIFEYYLNTQVSKSLIKSPFREDKNPTCGFYYNSNGILKLHDFATDEFFSAVDIVKRKFGLSYYKALDKILADKEKFDTIIEAIPQVREEFDWLAGDPSQLSYFNRYKVISIDILLRYKVFVARCILTNSYILSKGHKTNPLFVYIVDDKIKWYKPLSKDITKKWGGTTNSSTFFGFAQLPKKGKILFITSSLKDVMVLKGLGFNAIALNAEGYGNGEQSGTHLKKKINQLDKKFEHIFFYMNNDAAGMKFNIALANTYNKKYIHNPVGTPKDISDYIAHYGVRKTYRMLKKQISHKLKTVDDVPY